MSREKSISHLRMFFRVSNAAFIFANQIRVACDLKPIEDKMQQLHKLALEEIEKDNPDLLAIDMLLNEMEMLAESNKSKLP